MRLVFLGDSLVLQNAGIHHYNLQLLEAISSYPNIDSIDLVVPETIDALGHYNQIVVPIGKFPGHQRFRQFVEIPNVLNKLLPDVVIEPAHFGPFRLKTGIKRCTVIHDLTPLSYPDLHPRGSVWSHRLLLPSIIKKSDQIITNTHATASSIQQYSSNLKQIQVIYPSILSHDGSSNARSHQHEPYILAIGTLEPRKDYVTLVKAFEQISQDVDLVIVGGPGWNNEQFDQCVKRSPKKNQIHLKGYVSALEKEELIQNAKLFVSTSIAEGLGLPILEVMEYQIPVVCSDIPPYREIGGNAFKYADPRDVTQFVNLISEQLRSHTEQNFNMQISLWNHSRRGQLDDLFTTFDRWH